MTHDRSALLTHEPSRRAALRRAGWLALAAALPAWALHAQASEPAPAARIRLSAERRGREFEVGEVIVVRLEVWVSTWFQQPMDFPATLSAEGALVEAVGGSPESRFEEQGGQRWTGLIQRYRLSPVRPGPVSVALIEPLRVVPGGGRPLVAAAPAPLQLVARVPNGAEGIEPFVAARRLELRQNWSPSLPPDAAAPQVGDLIRREVVLVTDSSSLLVPAPEFAALGSNVRVQDPEVDEQRATAAAMPLLTRRHVAVYTLQQAGAVVLPPIELVWWDLRQRRRRVARLEGLTLEVRPAIARADPFAVPADSTAPAPAGLAIGQHVTWLAAAAGSVLLGVALKRQRRLRTEAAGSARRALAGSMTQAWRALKRGCRHDDARAAEAALRDVLNALDPAAREAWLADEAVARALTELERHRFGPQAPDGLARQRAGLWRGHDLWQALTRRRRMERGAIGQTVLPALHP